jgi:hypothetical protein
MRFPHKFLAGFLEHLQIVDENPITFHAPLT